MKNYVTTGQHDQDQKEIATILSAIRKLIKTNTYRKLARQMLDDIDLEVLNPENKVEYLYINGRYFYYIHKTQGDIDALEWGNDYMDDMATFAYDARVKLDLPMIYTRAYVKFLLGNLVWDQDRKPWLHQKTKQITERILNQDPSNSSFQWLYSQLSA